MQQLVHQVAGCGQGLGKRVKTGLAAGQRFAVADKFKARVNRIAQHIGDVIQVKRGQMPGPVLLSQCTERPTQRIAAVIIECIQRGKTRPLRQKPPSCDPVTQRGIAALQKRNGWQHGLLVTRKMVEKCVHAR